MAAYFGDGQLKANDLAAGIIGAVLKDPVQDKLVWQEYLETVVKTREDWKDIYRRLPRPINIPYVNYMY